MEGTAWNTQANLVEGNYVFYAPYNAAHLTRQPIVVTLPMEQDCAEESKSVTDFYAGTDPVTLGFDFLKAPANKDELISPSVKMTNIFAYPQITIKIILTAICLTEMLPYRLNSIVPLLPQNIP